MTSSASVRKFDKMPLAKHGWRDRYIGPKYYKVKQIILHKAPLAAHHFRGVCPVHARSIDNPRAQHKARSSEAKQARRQRKREGKDSGKGSGKPSGKPSRKCSDKSPGKGSGKGSGNAAQPPEPAASRMAKRVPGRKLNWPTPPEQSKAAKRKEPATTEDPKAANATKTKRQKSATTADPQKDDKKTRKTPHGSENAAVAATPSGARKENAGGARDNQWRKRDDWRPSPWTQDQ